MPDRNSTTFVVTGFEPGDSSVAAGSGILTAFLPEASGIAAGVAMLIVFEPAEPVETGLIGQVHRDRSGLIGSAARGSRRIGSN